MILRRLLESLIGYGFVIIITSKSVPYTRPTVIKLNQPQTAASQTTYTRTAYSAVPSFLAYLLSILISKSEISTLRPTIASFPVPFPKSTTTQQTPPTALNSQRSSKASLKEREYLRRKNWTFGEGNYMFHGVRGKSHISLLQSSVDSH